MTRLGANFAACVLIAAAVSCGGRGAPDLEGYWEGSISVPGMEIGIAVEFRGSGDSLEAFIDIPDQGAEDLPLTGVRQAGDSISFQLESGLGLASFHGIASGDSMIGSFSQGAFAGGFELLRTAPPEAPVLPYRSEAVTIQCDGYVISGTLTLPEGGGPFPGVVLLSGSGLQDRDETVFGFKVFGVLADSLTRNGIAVLRCDDRGIGGSTGDPGGLTDQIMAQDALAMFDYMTGREEIARDRVGFLGHSEGSSIAFLAASMRPAGEVAFVIAMAGPSVRGYEILLSQIEIISRQQGLSEERIAEALDAQRRVMDVVVEGGDVSVLWDFMREQARKDLEGLTPEALASLGDTAAFLDNAVAQSLMTIGSEWFHRFVTHDPAGEIGMAECPVLALYGGKDVQVAPALNEQPMRDALAGNPGGTVEVFPGANHLFQPAGTGAVSEYAGLPREFVPGFTGRISSWILETTGGAGAAGSAP